MNLVYIATRIAGKPMLMMREMGYDPKNLVYDAMESLDWSNGNDARKIYRQVNEAILRAWEKAGLQKDPNLDLNNQMEDDPRSMIHELEHLILDPNFSLGNGGSSSKRSRVESLVEEALSFGFGGMMYDEEGMDIATSNAYSWLHLQDNMNVGDLIKMLAEAPISTAERKTIRDSVVHGLKNKFSDRINDDLSSNIGQDSEKFELRPGLEIYYAVLNSFVRGVANKYEDYKQILEEELEEKWRKFNLHLKNEIKKIAPQALTNR